ncbi:MAG: hypothetical protein AAFV29_03985, partial [Myxococcota bacterium]
MHIFVIGRSDTSLRISCDGYATSVDSDRLTSLAADDAAAALQFCATEPDQCTYIAGWIAEGGLTRAPNTPRAWLMGEYDRTGRLSGLVYISLTGIMIPVRLSDDAIKDFGQMVRRNPNLARVVVGQRSLV